MMLAVGSVSEYKTFLRKYEYTRRVCVVVAPDIIIQKTPSKNKNFEGVFYCKKIFKKLVYFA